MGLAGVSELEHLAGAAALARADQALVLELLQRWVDRTGARTPHPVAALLHLLHDLVAVAWLLGQQQQRRGANVSAPGLAPATEATAPRPTETAEGEALEAAAPTGSKVPRSTMMSMAVAPT